MNIPKRIIQITFISAFLFTSSISNSMMAIGMACYENQETDLCKGLLIGTIDSAAATKKYCSDGRTSYGDIINSWSTEMRRFPEKRKLPTYLTMVSVIKNMGLACSK